MQLLWGERNFIIFEKNYAFQKEKNNVEEHYHLIRFLLNKYFF